MARVAELWKDLGRRGRVIALGAAGALLVVVPALSLGPVVRSKVSERARARGIDAEVGRVSASFRGVWLHDVKVTSRTARVRGSVGAVLVPFGGGEIRAHGGKLALRGTPAELRSELAAEGVRDEAKTGEGRRIAADGLALDWRELDARGSRVTAWGVSVERGPSGRVGVDLARFHGHRGRVEVSGLEVVSESGASGTRLRSARAARLDASIELEKPEPAATSPAASAPAPGAAPPASLSLAALPALRGAVKEAFPSGARVEVAAARFDLYFRDEHIGIGPSKLALSRPGDEIVLELAPAEKPGAGATPLALRGKLPLGEALPSLEVEGGPVSLALLGVKDGELGLSRTRDATVEAHLRLDLAPGGSVLATGSGKITNLSLQRRELGPRELDGVRFGFRGDAEVALDGSRVRVKDSEVSFGDVRFAGNLDFERTADGVNVRADAGVPLASCESMLSSLPAALIGDLGGLRLSGTFALASTLKYASAQPKDLELKLRVENDCRVVDAPPSFSPERFRSLFTREVKGPDGSLVLVHSGPGSPDYTPYAAIPRFMQVAVQVCEDGGFFRHRGFDFRAIEKALKADIEAGRFVRGASTISMQLAKNLYLGREKTLSRKIQEALLTMLLEERLSKQEILELYLNIVELGPGIYGIGQAAPYYFAKPATELSLAESLYLASILPDPTRQHFEPTGDLRPRWSEYLKKLMHIARKVELITDEELEAGLLEEVAFRRAGPPAGSTGGAELEPASDSTLLEAAPDFESLGP